MKKFLTVLFSLIILSTPCFAKQVTVNQFMSDFSDYMVANQKNINTASQLLMYQYLFFENYTWPEGWSRLVTADVCNCVLTAAKKPIPELTISQEYALKNQMRYQMVGMFSQMYAKSKEFPEAQKTMTAEQRKTIFGK